MGTTKFLVDTHCLLWFQDNNPKIPSRVLESLQNPDNIVLFSQLSLFEIAIKQKIGKLNQFTSDIIEIYHQGLQDNFTFLPVHNNHLSAYNKIPLLEKHRDPFDRLLIATAYEEKITILSADKSFSLYKDYISIMW
jgi:PIN domain nuclease of toxin-antitoxin system